MKKSYNLQNPHIWTEEQRERQSQTLKTRWAQPEFRESMLKNLKENNYPGSPRAMQSRLPHRASRS